MSHQQAIAAIKNMIGKLETKIHTGVWALVEHIYKEHANMLSKSTTRRLSVDAEVKVTRCQTRNVFLVMPCQFSNRSGATWGSATSVLFRHVSQRGTSVAPVGHYRIPGGFHFLTNEETKYQIFQGATSYCSRRKCPLG